MDNRDRLHEAISDALDRIKDVCETLEGPEDITEVFTDSDDYPALDNDPGVNYNRGLVEGIAFAYNMTVLELLDDLEIETDRR